MKIEEKNKHIRYFIKMCEYVVVYVKSFVSTLCKTYLMKTGRRNLKIIRMNKDLLPIQKALIQWLGSKKQLVDFINSYQDKTIKPMKIVQTFISFNEPVLICAVKDDLFRVGAQMKHYRNLGFKYFIYIDNGSTDGTYEFLREQEDVSLFTVDETFNSIKKTAWCKQVMDIFGYPRWYLVVDSDEFFCYPGMEQISIHQYITYLEQIGARSALAPMIDMYSRESIFSQQFDNLNETYCYFDTDTYCLLDRFYNRFVHGGPRERVFPLIVNLTKHPLIKSDASTISHCHANYPARINKFHRGAVAFLLHYKFMPWDIHKYYDNIKAETYFNGSIQYKGYMEAYEKRPTMSFYYEKSHKLNDSMDLLKINICDKRFFTDLFFTYGIDFNWGNR